MNWIRKQICGMITVGVATNVEEVTPIEVWLVLVLITDDGIERMVIKTTQMEMNKGVNSSTLSSLLQLNNFIPHIVVTKTQVISYRLSYRLHYYYIKCNNNVV